MKLKNIIAVCAVLLIGLLYQVASSWPDSNLHLVFCDVGQGDAILIQYGFWQMLVDTGPDEKVMSCLRQHIPFWDKTLENVVLTHSHDDHIGGVESVAAEYSINNLFLNDFVDTQEFKNMLLALNSNTNIKAMFRNGFLGCSVAFKPGGVVNFLAPNSSEFSVKNMNLNQFSETMLSDVIRAEYVTDEDPNERSIVLFLHYHQFDFLLMGDAVAKNELALIQNGLISKVEGLKVGHHGAKTSSSPTFLQKIQPEFSVVSCGVNNKFGHPALEVLQRLQKMDSQIWRTDELGTVHLITNGHNYWLSK